MKLNEEYDFSYDDNQKTYHNEIDEANYICQFSGFNLDPPLLYKDREGSGDIVNLRDKNIEATLNKDKIYWRIRILMSSIGIFKNMIRESIIPSVQYKI